MQFGKRTLDFGLWVRVIEGEYMIYDKGIPADRTDDIVEVLRDDHAELRLLLSAGAPAGSSEHQEVWLRLADALVRHAVAEQLVVYPALLELPAGRAISHSRTAAHQVILRQLVSLERAGFGTAAFNSAEVRLGLDVLAHLDKEDTQVLPLLASRFGAHRRAELGRRFVETGRIEPTPRILPGARLPAGPTIVDHTTALAVWIRDSAMAQGLAS